MYMHFKPNNRRLTRGTRATYTVKDEYDEYHVFIHWDGYPEGAIKYINSALPFAWELPRFEADEFAAALAAGAKTMLSGGSYQGGSVRLMHTQFDARDIEYRYVIYAKDGKLQVDAYSTNYWDEGKEKEKIFYSGDFATFNAKHGDCRHL